MKTPERGEWRRSGVFIHNFKQISHIVLVFPLFPLNKQMSTGLRVFIVRGVEKMTSKNWTNFFFQ